MMKIQTRATGPTSRLFKIAAFALVLMAALAAAQAAVATEITDLRGRHVDINTPVDTISIDDGRFLVALALLDPDPGQFLAAWPKDINRIGKAFYQSLEKASPSLAKVPRVASSAGTFNLEALLAADPDVAVVSLGRGPTEAQVQTLKAAGIAVVYIDFFQHPLEDQARSLKILGQLIGREKAAQAYIEFRDKRLEAIRAKVAQLPAKDKPTVFLEAHAGITNACCYSPGRGNLGEYINLVGGHNIGADVITGSSGQLSLEYVISTDPDVYIATGEPALRTTGGLVLGPGIDQTEARQSFQHILARPGISELGAVNDGRAHGLSHLLLNSPLDIVAVQWMAKWIHPALFRTLDPTATLAEINQRFLAVPYGGTNWLSQPASNQSNSKEKDK